MITHDEALDLIQRHVRPLGTEEVAIAECPGRVLAQDVEARIDSPPFNKSAMDGYAVRAEDVADLPAELRQVGQSFAGGWPDFHVGPGECAEITTGAAVPEGADTVVMVEDTARPAEGAVRIDRLTGLNICPRGEDIQVGQTVLTAGHILTPLRVGVAASVGHDRLLVHRKPSIALLCTGTEVVSPPDEAGPGQIYDSNGPILSALLEPFASEFEFLGIARDQPGELEAAIRRGLKRDLFVVAGGVSVGPYDLVPDTLRKAGVEVVFHKCAIKPGKPGLFGTHAGRGDAQGYVFGVPGNPQSGFLIFHVLMQPLLGLLSGGEDSRPVYRTGVVRTGFRNKPGRKTFKPCRIEADASGTTWLDVADWRGSADIMGTSSADGFLVVPQGVSQVSEGESLKFFEM